MISLPITFNDFDNIYTLDKMIAAKEFFDKYNPNQFEIIMIAGGNSKCNTDPKILKFVKYRPDKRDKGGSGIINGKPVYVRIFIKNKKL